MAAKVKGLADSLARASPGNEQERRQLGWAGGDLAAAAASLDQLHGGGAAVSSATVRTAEQAEWSLMRAHDALETQPPLRLKAPLVCDPRNGKVVLFGGDRGDHLCAETWTYDLKTRTWAEQRPAVSPPPRGGHALVYLPQSGRVLLLGGYEYGKPTGKVQVPIPRMDMWSYDVAANRWQLVKHFEATNAPVICGGYEGCVPAVAAAGPGDVVLVPVYRGWTCRATRGPARWTPPLATFPAPPVLGCRPVR